MGVLEIMSDTVWKLMFPSPHSWIVAGMSVLSLGMIAGLGSLEVFGIHLQYSKFWNTTDPSKPKKSQIKLSSKLGMLVLYTPAVAVGIATFWIFPDDGFRALLVKSAVTFHFFKRDLEVLFVHKYSGGMILDSALLISFSYTSATATMIYAQHLAQEFPDPSIDLKYPGILIFLVGIVGNTYHHLILASLRSGGDKVYRVPSGGLFEIVTCPHYLFEIIIFIGITLMSQTLYTLCFTIGTTGYLMGRSYSTRKWYLSKFEDYPRNKKALIPFVF